MSFSHQQFKHKRFIPLLTDKALSSSPFSSLPAAISCRKPKMSLLQTSWWRVNCTSFSITQKGSYLRNDSPV